MTATVYEFTIVKECLPTSLHETHFAFIDGLEKLIKIEMQIP
jgi:hypothetical protein